MDSIDIRLMQAYEDVFQNALQVVTDDKYITALVVITEPALRELMRDA